MLILLFLISYFTPLNAAEKNDRKKLISLFGPSEPEITPKKSTAKLINLFDSVQLDEKPKQKQETKQKYSTKEIQQEKETPQELAKKIEKIEKEKEAPQELAKKPEKDRQTKTEIAKKPEKIEKEKPEKLETAKKPEKQEVILTQGNDWRDDDLKFFEFDNDKPVLGKPKNKIITTLTKKPKIDEDDEDYSEYTKEITFEKGANYYDKVTKMVKNAFSLIGSAYKFGSNNRDKTYDCSLFTQRTFAKIGLKLPRSSIEQAALGKKVSKDNLVVGDLLFFTTYRKTVSHVGIYIGDNKMIHASTQKGVAVDDLDDAYYKKRYLFAKRPSFENTKNY